MSIISMEIFERRRNCLIFAVTIGLLLGALFSSLNVIHLRSEEPRRALVALEMIFSGDFLAPHVNGDLYYNKPPLYSWVAAAFFRAFDSYEYWTVRLPSPIFILLTCIINYFVVMRFIQSRQIALLSSFFYATSENILFFFSFLGEIDLFYSFLVFLQAIAIFSCYEKKKWPNLFLISYTLTAAGVLTKGAPSIAFQIVTLAAMAIAERRARWLTSVWHGAGIAVFSALVGGYFYLYSRTHDLIPFITKLLAESTTRSFVDHSLLSLANGALQCLSFAAFMYLPWTVLVAFALRRGALKEIRTQPLLRFCALFIAANFPLYLLSPGTRMRYLFMFLPFLSVLLAALYTSTPAPDKRHTFFRGIVGIILATNLLVFIALPYLPEAAPWQNIQYVALLYAVITLGYFLLFLRRAFPDILLLGLALVTTRTAYNAIYFPVAARINVTASYSVVANDILRITQNAPVYLFSKPFWEKTTARVFGKTILSTPVRFPTFLPHQLSFEISRTNRHIVRATDELVPERFYLTPKVYLPPHAKILYEFFDHFSRSPYILFIIE